MSFEMSCPGCKQALLLENEHVGCSVVCPVCNHEFTVERQDSGPPPVSLQIKQSEPVPPPAEISELPKNKSSKKKKKLKYTHNGESKLTAAANKTIKKIKAAVIFIIIGFIAYCGYNIYKDIYWSTKLLESIHATLTSDDTRVVYHSIDELKIENKELQQLKLPDNEKVIKMLNQYIYLFVLSQDKLTVVKTLIEDIPESDYKVFIGDIVRMCRKCDRGFAVCRYCKGTKKCHVCKGTGRVESLKVDGDDSYSTSSCRTDCAYCSSPVVCKYCRGNVFLYDRAEIKNIVPLYKAELIKTVQHRIAEYKSFSYVGEQFLDRFFALFSKSNIKNNQSKQREPRKFFDDLSNNQSEQQAQSTKTLSLNKKSKSRRGQVADVALIEFSASDGKSKISEYFLSLNCTHCNRHITAECGARKIICPYCKNMVILKNQNPLACRKQR